MAHILEKHQMDGEGKVEYCGVYIQ